MSGWFLDDESPAREDHQMLGDGPTSMGGDGEETPARELEEIGSVNGSPSPLGGSSGKLSPQQQHYSTPRHPKKREESTPRQSPSSSSSDGAPPKASPNRKAWGADRDFSDDDRSDAEGREESTDAKKVVGGEDYSRVAGIDPSLPVEEQLHLVWRKYSDHIYDFFAQHFLEYPSNTVAFTPNSRRRFFGADFAMHQMYLGTTSPNNDNYLSLYNIYTPAELEESDLEDMVDRGEAKVSGSYTDVANMIQRTLRVSHDGPVVRIRPCPTRPHLVCTRSTKATLTVYDLEAISGGLLAGRDSDSSDDDSTGTEGQRKRKGRRSSARPDLSRPTASSGKTVTCNPTVVLRGPQRAGIGLEWHPTEENILAVSSYDQKVYLYDVESNTVAESETGGAYRGNHSAGPSNVLKGHTEEVYDVSWHHTHRDTLLSCGAEGKVLFWDRRTGAKTMSAELHKCPVLASTFHPTGQFAFATGSMDGPVRVWDFRSLSKPVYSLVAHRGPVTGLHWAPFSDSVLMSHSTDGSIVIWDLLKASQEAQPCDQNANPELVFQHYGHSSPVRDACWCADANDAWTVLGVDDHNTVQIWSPAPKILNDYTDPDLEVPS